MIHDAALYRRKPFDRDWKEVAAIFPKTPRIAARTGNEKNRRIPSFTLRLRIIRAEGRPESQYRSGLMKNHSGRRRPTCLGCGGSPGIIAWIAPTAQIDDSHKRGRLCDDVFLSGQHRSVCYSSLTLRVASGVAGSELRDASAATMMASRTAARWTPSGAPEPGHHESGSRIRQKQIWIAVARNR